MRELMAIRYPVYATADITVESREVPHEEIVGEIIDALAVEPPLAIAAAGSAAANRGAERND